MISKSCLKKRAKGSFAVTAALFSQAVSYLSAPFFPAFCRKCQTWLLPGQGAFFCPACWESIILTGNFCNCCGLPLFTPASSSVCGECRQNPPPFRRARSVGVYEGTLRQAIHVFKYEGKIRLGQQLAGLMASCFPRYWPAWGYDFVLPIPLHLRRLRQREFNQSLILAHFLGQRFNTPVLADNLQRARFDQPQVGLKGRERLRNVRGCFSLSQSAQVEGKEVLLVDDVYTTGATVKECARVLTKAGARAVDVYTLGRTRT